MRENSTYLVLLAHGSRDPHWQKPFEALSEQIALAQENPVKLAYMELCTPSLNEVIEEIAQEQYKRVEILPLFFAAGRHLRVDVPNQIKDLERLHPQLKINLGEPVGLHPIMTQALIEVAGNLHIENKPL